MKKIYLFVLIFGIIFSMKINARDDDVGFASRIILSNSAISLLLNSLDPGQDVDTINSKDKMMLYYAIVGILNPTKQKFVITVSCVDKEGNIVISGEVVRDFSKGSEEKLDGNIIKTIVQTIGLDPRPGAMVPGQKMPLKDKTDYFIKLFIEKKLIGITKFTYYI